MKKFSLILAFLSASAFAQSKTDGNQLLSDLKDESNFRNGFGNGYVTAIADSLDDFCPPKGVTNGQLYDIVKNFIEQNPAIRHYHRLYIAQHALKTTYPCKQDPATKSKKPV